MKRKEMNWNFKKLDQFLHAAVNAMPAKVTEEGSITDKFLFIYLLNSKGTFRYAYKEPDLTRATCNNRALNSKQ